MKHKNEITTSYKTDNLPQRPLLRVLLYPVHVTQTL